MRQKFLGKDPRNTGNGTKNKQMGYIKLCCKGNCQQTEEATNRMVRNFYKLCN